MKQALDLLMGGLENCIDNARLRNDAYDVGYMSAMKKTVNEALAALPSGAAQAPLTAEQLAKYWRVVEDLDGKCQSVSSDECANALATCLRALAVPVAPPAAAPVLMAPEGEDPMRYGDRKLEDSVKRLRAAYCVQQPLPIPDQMALVWRFDIGRLYHDWIRLNAWQKEVVSKRDDSAPQAKWSNGPPTKQGIYWHWTGDLDAKPIPLSVLWSGHSGKCFVSIGQYGITQAIDCDEYSGYWQPAVEPAMDEEIGYHGSDA
ncbi:hypothetical protein [Paraburkholderia sp. J10-1]|uniref:hypothetical protein n=1 Tax=Paraburkholderia sp. J10-1 TaxID=2805430 RepID=UPI002AB740E0|nr:hypothetical protein [Paraburkholderia sp. J10-1]